MTPLRRRMIDDMTLRNFTPATIRAYVRCARYFACPPDRLGPEHVRSYLLHLLNERHISMSHYDPTRCALRFFYHVTLGRDDVPQSIAPARAGKGVTPEKGRRKRCQEPFDICQMAAALGNATLFGYDKERKRGRS